MKLLDMLGAKNEEEAMLAVKELASLPVVLTVMYTPSGNINISCAGNIVSTSTAQDILLTAVKQLANKQAEENSIRAGGRLYSPQSKDDLPLGQ